MLQGAAALVALPAVSTCRLNTPAKPAALTLLLPCLPSLPPRYVSLAEAQRKGLKVDWSDPVNKPVTPKVLGTTVYSNYPIEQVVDYIDWNPFFQVGAMGARGGLLDLNWQLSVAFPAGC
jgi:hypothetical protein